MKWWLSLSGLFFAAIVIVIGMAIFAEITEPDSGTVTKKEYQRAWTTTSCTGKPVHCSTTHHPECYRVVYRNNGDTGDNCVTPAEYDRIRVGEHYSK